MVRQIPVELELLKEQYQPPYHHNVVEQMRIIHEALNTGGAYEEDVWGLADYLGISESKVSQMKKSHVGVIPEMKDYLVANKYEGNMAYKFCRMTPEEQQLYLDANSSDTTIIQEDEKE